MTRLDETNVQLLLLLQKDGRMSVADLATAVGRSESTVRERMGSLEREGLLRGYHADIDWSRAGLPASVVLHARCDPAKLPELRRRLASLPNVTAASVVTGDRPLMAHLQVRDMQHLREILQRSLPDLVAPEARVVLESLVDWRPPTVPGAGADLDPPSRG
ncbi:MAG: Lrp/AsnC family transcriptional regulator [bacterium]